MLSAKYCKYLIATWTSNSIHVDLVGFIYCIYKSLGENAFRMLPYYCSFHDKRIVTDVHRRKTFCWLHINGRKYLGPVPISHYNDVILGAIASQITSLTIVFATVYLDTERKHQSSASLAFVRGIPRRPVNSPHKWSVTRKMFPFDDVIMR